MKNGPQARGTDAKLRRHSGPTTGPASGSLRLQSFLDVINCRQRPWFAVITPPSPPQSRRVRQRCFPMIFTLHIRGCRSHLKRTLVTRHVDTLFRATLSFYRTDRNAERNVSWCAPGKPASEFVSIVFEGACVLRFGRIAL